MPRLLLKAEMQKMAQLQDADGEGRKQAHIDTIMSMTKRAARARAWATMMRGEMEKEALSFQPVKAVGSKILGGLRSLVGRGTSQAAGRGAARGATDVVGKLRGPIHPPPSTAAGEIITPGVHLQSPGAAQPQGFFARRRAARQATQAAKAEVAKADLANLQQTRQLTPGVQLPGAPQQPQGFFARRRAAQEATRAAKAEIAKADVAGGWRSMPQQQQTLFGGMRPVPKAAPTAVASPGAVAPPQAEMAKGWGQIGKPPQAAPMTSVQAQPHTGPGFQRISPVQPAAGSAAPATTTPGQVTPAAPRQPVVEHGRAGRLGAPAASAEPAELAGELATARESAKAGLQTPAAAGARPVTPSGEGVKPVNRRAAQRAQAAETKLTGKAAKEMEVSQRAAARSKIKELEEAQAKGTLTAEQAQELATARETGALTTGERATEAKRKLKWGLMAGIGLPAAALTYGAIKTAPHVVGALGQASAYPMAPGGGWSPTDYGYGSNPYGPGALNLGPGA